jgi:hypothetical protein
MKPASAMNPYLETTPLNLLFIFQVSNCFDGIHIARFIQHAAVSSRNQVVTEHAAGMENPAMAANIPVGDLPIGYRLGKNERTSVEQAGE